MTTDTIDKQTTDKLIELLKIEPYSQLLTRVTLHHKTEISVSFLPSSLLLSLGYAHHTASKVCSTINQIMEKMVSDPNPLILLKIVQNWVILSVSVT